MSKSNNMTVLRSKELLFSEEEDHSALIRLVCSRYYVRSLQRKIRKSARKMEKIGYYLISAGTSIGAMNGAILVSQFLQTGNWEKASGIT